MTLRSRCPAPGRFNVPPTNFEDGEGNDVKIRRAGARGSVRKLLRTSGQNPAGIRASTCATISRVTLARSWAVGRSRSPPRGLLTHERAHLPRGRVGQDGNVSVLGDTFCRAERDVLRQPLSPAGAAVADGQDKARSPNDDCARHRWRPPLRHRGTRPTPRVLRAALTEHRHRPQQSRHRRGRDQRRRRGASARWRGLEPAGPGHELRSKKNILLEYDWFDDNVTPVRRAAHPPSDGRPVPIASAPPSPPPPTSTLTAPPGSRSSTTTGRAVPSPAAVVRTRTAASRPGSTAPSSTRSRPSLRREPPGLLPLRADAARLQHHTRTSSGQAELPGNDLVVSLQCFISTNNVANTIMHELGHNLFLQHGGNESCNWKPNYDSVMNYRGPVPRRGHELQRGGEQRRDQRPRLLRGARVAASTRASLNEAAGTCVDRRADRLGTSARPSSPASCTTRTAPPLTWSGAASRQRLLARRYLSAS